jgi:hypothetical protein
MVPDGQGWGHKRGNCFYICILERILILRLNIWPISIKLGANISYVMGTQVYSNVGPSPLKRGDNHKSAEIG